MRKDGYYWVKREGAYAIACWDETNSVWWWPGREEGLTEGIEVVSEFRLIPPVLDDEKDAVIDIGDRALLKLWQ